MSVEGALPWPPGIRGFPLGFWTLCASFHRFAWAVRRGKLSPFAFRADPASAAMAVWLNGLDIRIVGENLAVNNNVDENLLDWLVESVGFV